MSVRDDIKSLNEAMIPGTGDMLVKEWSNCRISEIDVIGDVWVEDPQRGHWLTQDELSGFLAFLETTDLDAAQERHDPEWSERKKLAASR